MAIAGRRGAEKAGFGRRTYVLSFERFARGAEGEFMKHQPKPDYVSNDDVQTPEGLCLRLVRHFRPSGSMLEPCRGDGNFYDAMTGYIPNLENYGPQVDYCEIKEGVDFMDYDKKVKWIITNPPFSKAKAFMEKSFQVADNVVFLITLNHVLGLKARFRLLDKYGFGIREAILLDTPPKPWPQAGFQLGAVHFERGYEGPMKWTDFREAQP